MLNSAVIGEAVPAGGTVADVGSGAGLPGIPLALARPDCTVILIEPLERRAAFLSEVVADLGLPHVRVVRGRAEDVADEVAGADVVVSRAVAPLAKLAGWCVPLARSGGLFLAIKGSSAESEVERDRAAVARLGIGDLRVRSLGGELLEVPTTVVIGVVRGSRAAGRRAARRRP